MGAGPHTGHESQVSLCYLTATIIVLIIVHPKVSDRYPPPQLISPTLTVHEMISWAYIAGISSGVDSGQGYDIVNLVLQ